MPHFLWKYLYFTKSNCKVHNELNSVIINNKIKYYNLKGSKMILKTFKLS